MSRPRIISSDILSRFRTLRFGMSTRQGGTSPEPLGMNLSFRVGDDPDRVEENRRQFFGALGFDPRHLAIPLQCHSSHIQSVNLPGEYDSCDGLVTATKNLPLVITVADCLPIVLFDPNAVVLGHVHAGWRGSASGIVRKAVAIMKNEFGASPDLMVAYLGPSAGVCCYEVGREVADVFSPDQLNVRNERIYLNLKKENMDQLLECGLRSENIEISDSCTICSPELFHSYRRDREKSGRMMAVVSILGNEAA
jgi:YfiH family protein